MRNKSEQKLFDLLISLGFTLMETDKFLYFKNGKELFVFPHKLYAYHYLHARKHLDMNGWIDEEDFNEMFNL